MDPNARFEGDAFPDHSGERGPGADGGGDSRCHPLNGSRFAERAEREAARARARTEREARALARTAAREAARAARKARAAARQLNAATQADKPSEALKDAGQDLQEIVDYGKALIEIRKDKANLAVRRSLVKVAVGAVGGVAGATFVIIATLLFARGLAGGLTALFDGRAWLGEIVAGLLLFTALGLGAWLFVSSRSRAEFEKKKTKYEQLRVQHRARFGHHVADSQHARADSGGERGGAP